MTITHVRPKAVRTTALALALSMGLASGCAAERLQDARGLDVIVRAAPGTLTADSAARTIRSATQCDAEVVRTLATGALVLRLWPTQRAPDVQKCLTQLKSLPGVQSAEPDAAMKPS
jgi:hypothetical protein